MDSRPKYLATKTPHFTSLVRAAISLRSLHRMMADRLDPIAVGIPEEGGVIRGVIIAQTRRAVVGAACSNPGVPERVHLGAPLRLKTPVAAEGFLGLWALADGEIDPVRIGRACPLAVAEPVVAAADLDDFERLHDRIVEPLGRGDVRHRDGNVVQHRSVLDDISDTSAVVARSSRQNCEAILRWRDEAIHTFLAG